MLAVDYALKPVLNALKAQEISTASSPTTAGDRLPAQAAVYPGTCSGASMETLETFWQALHRPAASRAVINVSAWGGTCNPLRALTLGGLLLFHLGRRPMAF